MAVPSPLPGAVRRVLLAALAAIAFAVFGGLAAAPNALAHDGVQEGLMDEPVIPGLDYATDFQIASNGDVYVAHHDGLIERFVRTASSTVAHPSYNLTPQLIYKFQTTVQNDRGLVGITLDSDFDGSHRYLYALITRGSKNFVGNIANNPNGVRRTAQLVRVAVPTSGAAKASDVSVIVGADAPADPDSTCKPYTAGQAAAQGETDAAPNGVVVDVPPHPKDEPGDTSSKFPYFTEANVYPDGDLSTRADGAYDCIPSDADTHGLGTVISEPDGSLLISVGDASPWQIAAAASLRSYNLESYAGKILHVDRSGHGLASHPFCAGETDLTRTCTKIWARGLRNGFRMNALPPDPQSPNGPVVAVGDVGNYTEETLTVVHGGDNLGWPCWEGTYWNYFYAAPSAGGIRTAWGGPEFLPTSAAGTSCQALTTGGDGSQPTPSGVKFPNLEYQHDQGTDSNGAAIVSGPLMTSMPGSDPAVALPSSWTGSMFFGDYARGWLDRIAPDTGDPGNTQNDGGLKWPADLGHGPEVRTDANTAGTLTRDPLLDQIADPPASGSALSPWYRLTLHEGPDGTLWYLRYSGETQGGAIYRIRTAPAAEASFASQQGACAAPDASGQVTLTASDAGTGATYAWDLNGDGVADSGRTGMSTTITAAQLSALTDATTWVRLIVTAGGEQSVATRCVFKGTPPDLSITSPADGTQVVLGQSVVVTGSRPAGDADSTDIPDDDLRWQATTVHGSSHEHALLTRDGAYETVNGQQKMQLTLTTDPTHELGSYTRVRFFSPEADPGDAKQTIRLYPKPVQVTLTSSPAGAPMSMARDLAPSVVPAAPGSFTAAAGYLTTIQTATSFVDSKHVTWYFVGWSDGQSAATRAWQVPGSGGTAPTAIYSLTMPTPTPTPTPLPTPTPVTALTPTPAPILTPTPTPINLGNGQAPTVPSMSDLTLAPLVVAATGSGKKAAFAATLSFGHAVAGTGLVAKVAVRAADCRWWSFSHKALSGPSRSSHSASVRRAALKRCNTPQGWKLATSTWSGTHAVVSVAFGAAPPKGRYAVRIRFQRGATVLSSRVRALRIS